MRRIAIIGQGVRLSNAIDELRQFIEWSNMPFIHTKLACDILPGHRLNMGGVGIKSPAKGNDMAKLADKVYVIGASLPYAVRGYENDILPLNKVVIEIEYDIEKTLRFIRVRGLPV